MAKNQVFGNMNLVVSVNVNSEEEAMALQEANFNVNTDRIIAFKKIIAIDWNGKEIEIDVHEALDIELTEFAG